MNKVEENNLINGNNPDSNDCRIKNYYINHYNDFISELCHEMNNHLTLMNSTAQLLELKYPKINNIKHWESLINHINAFIEYQSNYKEFRKHLDIEISKDNLLETIENFVDTIKPIVRKNNTYLILDIDEELKIYYKKYYFDKTRITQALRKIIDYIVFETVNGGNIEISCMADETNLIIEVKGDSMPVDKELSDKTLFRNVNNKTPKTIRDLEIARSIILLHMGNIDVNTVDEEISFIIKLPKDSKC